MEDVKLRSGLKMMDSIKGSMVGRQAHMTPTDGSMLPHKAASATSPDFMRGQHAFVPTFPTNGQESYR